ncbi:MAG TPA: HAD hydrolase-like protein, partial [Solirubrobacteraceae bacterium]
LPGIAAGVNAVLGTDHTRETIRPYVGPPLHDSFATLTGRDDVDAIVAEYRRVYAEIMVDGTTVFDGIEAALQALADDGTVLAVATSKAKPLADALLDGLGLAHFFAAVAGPVPPARDDKTATIADALAQLGRPTDDVTMVGDRHHDIDGARAHGIRAIGVTWGFGTREELAGADALIDAPAELLARVASG